MLGLQRYFNALESEMKDGYLQRNLGNVTPANNINYKTFQV